MNEKTKDSDKEMLKKFIQERTQKKLNDIIYENEMEDTDG